MTTGVAALQELNLDGLVGPTHNYAGLAHGNLASAQHQGLESNPKAAALEGIAKMRVLLGLGLLQGLLPPHPRPNLSLLHRLGFTGDLGFVLDQAAQRAPSILAASYSASAMWTANAATICPSSDSLDGRTHITPANLLHSLHRHQEARQTTRVLRSLFRDPEHFVVHDALPAVAQLSDEGAANHTRLQTEVGSVQLFAWGRTSEFPASSPQIFPARQTLEACRAVARLHQLKDEPLYWQQEPRGIDAGAFHTDVLAVGNGAVLLLHEDAFANTETLLAQLGQRLGPTFRAIVARRAELPIKEAVQGYAFNSQLVTLPNGKMRIVAPLEASELPGCRDYLARVLDEAPQIEGVTYVPVRQSMSNGGGPACLRLRVPLTQQELSALAPQAVMSETVLTTLETYINTHYRDRVAPADLRDPEFARESLETHAALMAVLHMETPLG
jgi:succinylarginine dihydrolase